ncbi:MAG: hypothetical protein AAFQ22_09570 [Pseudomonadota bacterium]
MLRNCLPALALAFAFIATPAVADTLADNDIDFEIALTASAAETLANIKAEAWAACAPTPGSASVFDRSHVARRSCQDALVRDVVNKLADPNITAALEADAVPSEG